MNIEIDTIEKTITISGEVDIEELKKVSDSYPDFKVQTITKYIKSDPIPYQLFPLDIGIKKTHFDFCSCNPKNGGSGICHCTMGGSFITCNPNTEIGINKL